MVPIVTRYGPFFLYSYTVVVSLGILAGIGLSAWQAKSLSRPGWVDGLLISLVAGVFGGRFLFVWWNTAYYQEHPDEIWQVWAGLHEQGALLAAIVAVLGWCIVQRRDFYQYAGLFAPAGVLFAAFLWLACWFEGCAYGRETVIGPFSADLPDVYGVFAVRYHTQLAGMILSLLAFCIVWYLRRRLSPGRLFWLALLLIAAGRLAIAPFRGDLVPLVGPWRVDVIIDSMVLILAVGGIILARPKVKSPDMVGQINE